MPCVVCDGLLAVREFNSDNQTHLYCPRCEGLDIESRGVVRAKTEYLIEDSKVNAGRIPHGLGDYQKSEVLSFLIVRLNRHLNRFFEKNGMYTFEVGYLASLIYAVYRAQGFGNKSIDDPKEFADDVTVLRDGFAVLHRAFLDAHQGFSICERKTNFSGDFNDFADDYNRLPSEYWLGFHRIVTALACGDAADWDTYTTVTDEIRNFRGMFETDDPQTVEEYGDFWYQLIIQLKVIASMDPIINDVYFTRMPEEITIFHIEEFLDELDTLLDPIKELKASEGQPVVLDEETIDQAGKQAFGEYWKEVRPLVIVGEDRLDAHPFLFEITHTEEYNLAEADGTTSIEKTEFVYPRDYARLVKYQIFPLLQNEGTAESGHRILTKLTEKRADKYEEQFYEYLEPKSTECYLRPELAESDGSELDLIYVSEDEIHLIELKLFMPPPNLRSKEGITTINQKFNLPIFNEEVDDVPRTASGPTLPDKMNQWRSLNRGHDFNADRSSGTGEHEKPCVGKDWWEKDVKQVVVSNLTPTYVEKQGIRFLTDFEYVKLVDEGDDSVLYPIWDGRQEQNRN